LSTVRGRSPREASPGATESFGGMTREICPGLGPSFARRALLLFEALAGEFESPAVLGHGANDMIRGTGRDLGDFTLHEKARRVGIRQRDMLSTA